MAEVDALRFLKDRSHFCRIQLLLPIRRVESIDFLFDVRSIFVML